MELKIKSGIFYMLDADDEKRLFDNEEESIEALKSLVSKNEEIDPESLCIYEVNTTGDKWEIKSIPWAKIAMKLMKGGK